MKNIIRRTTSIAIIILLTISSQIFATSQYSQADEKDKLVVKLHAPIIKVLADVFELSNVDLSTLENQLDDMKAITLTYAEKEVDLVIASDAFEFLGLTEDFKSRQLEDWMFEDLGDTEEITELEEWMYAENYYSEEYESDKVEDWMFNELIEPDEELEIENWMFEELNPSEDDQLENWMFNLAYYN